MDLQSGQQKKKLSFKALYVLNTSFFLMLMRPVSDSCLADQPLELQFRSLKIEFSMVVTILKKKRQRTSVVWVGVTFILRESVELSS